MEAFFEKGTLHPGGPRARPAPGACSRAGSSPCCPPPRMRNVGMHPLLDAIVDLLPEPGGPRRGGGHRSRHARPRSRASRRPTRPSPPSSSRPSPTRTPAASASSASTRGRSSPTPPCTTRPATWPSAWAHLELLRGQDPDPGARRSRPATSARWPSSRTPRPATRCATRRTRSSTRRWSTPSRPPPSPSSPRRAATRTRSPPRCTGIMEEDPVLRLSRDAQTHEMLLSGHGPAPHRGRGRQAAQALQGRGQPQEAEDPLPRDDQGRGGGPRPAQEADRRPRAVRRLQDPHEAAAARRRTSSSWTTSSAAPSPRTSSPRWRRASRRRACAGFVAGFPMVDFQVELFDGAVPRRGLLGDVVQDRGLAGLQGRGGQVPAHASWSRS